MFNNKAEAKEAYKKFVRSNRRFLFLTDKKEYLKNFEDIQKEDKAYNSMYLGVREVPIDRIVGSVQKYTDFDKNFVPINKIVEARWCNIYLAYMTDQSLPLVQLYKVKDDYYVYDGNHRISVANYLRFATIEAEVTEFLPSKDKKEEALYRERFLFEKEYGISNLQFTEIYFFGRIKKEIKEFGNYLYKVEGKKDINRMEKARLWNNLLYKNAYKILEINKMDEYFNERSLSDIYIYYLDHKYYESEKRGYNLGYYEGIISFVNTIKSHANKELSDYIALDRESRNLLKKIDNLDFRYKTKDIHKHDLLRKNFGEKNYRNIRLLEEIDNYRVANGIGIFGEALKAWKSEVYFATIDLLKKRASVLNEEINEFLEELVSENMKLYFSIIDYERIYKMKYKETNYGGVVNYILDILIPIITHLKESKIKCTLEAYFNIFEKYHYLIEYNPNVGIKKAVELYYEEQIKKTNMFYNRITNKNKIDILLESMPNNMAAQSTPSYIFLNELMEEYGMVGDYSTLIKIYEYIQLHLERGYELEECEAKVVKELEALKDSDEISSFYKTEYVLDLLKNKKSMSFLDFYQNIINIGNGLGDILVEVDILDLALEYMNTKYA